MKRMWEKWYDTSIQTKSVLLMGTMMVTMWLLVIVALAQLHNFSSVSSIIMNDYIDISGFLNAFSTENIALESYIRPLATEDARDEYLEAIQQTDVQMQALRYNIKQDPRQEYMLKRAIYNAMEYYRKSQQELLALSGGEDRIQPYLSLKTQSAYIDSYARDLLHCRIVQGGEQWREIEQTNRRSSDRFMVFSLASTVMMVLLLLVFHRSILRPLLNLGRAADQIRSGCYDAPPLEVKGDDELGRTAHSFNLMQQEIRRTIHALEQQSEMEKHLLEREVEAAQMQRKLQESRFAQLQSQINPHFLFNTLSTIAALAREEEAPLSENLILRLSRFFRYSLESGETMVTLGQELDLLQDYIELQETRYMGRVAFEVLTDPDLNGLRIPKFTLQPLVENAIIHGFQARPGGGLVRLRARRRNGGAVITVTDNGRGFDPKAARPARGPHQSVGLDNITERIKLTGGKVDVFSRPGFGTCVRIFVGGGEHD